MARLKPTLRRLKSSPSPLRRTSDRRARRHQRSVARAAAFRARCCTAAAAEDFARLILAQCGGIRLERLTGAGAQRILAGAEQGAEARRKASPIGGQVESALAEQPAPLEVVAGCGTRNDTQMQHAEPALWPDAARGIAALTESDGGLARGRPLGSRSRVEPVVQFEDPISSPPRKFSPSSGRFSSAGSCSSSASS